jgi:hypothetical protein
VERDPHAVTRVDELLEALEAVGATDYELEGERHVHAHFISPAYKRRSYTEEVVQ